MPFVDEGIVLGTTAAPFPYPRLALSEKDQQYHAAIFGRTGYTTLANELLLWQSLFLFEVAGDQYNAYISEFLVEQARRLDEPAANDEWWKLLAGQEQLRQWIIAGTQQAPVCPLYGWRVFVGSTRVHCDNTCMLRTMFRMAPDEPCMAVD